MTIKEGLYAIAYGKWGDDGVGAGKGYMLIEEYLKGTDYMIDESRPIFDYPVQKFILHRYKLDHILGIKRTEVKLVTYREEYNLLFACESKKIAAAIRDNVIEIYHVGSTSIMGAIAKPLLDISVCVKDIRSIDIPAIEAMGYECIDG